ncbi:MAG: apolipoprotein N-acyltransferase [Microscillaceae bacterium]|jgi:apolipoprotein N-acyltransferase|nr:apolipoprotein N-acyltransferase [Microscillaceae bacterium]
MQKKTWFLSILSGLLLAGAWLISPIFLLVAWLPWLNLEARMQQNPTQYPFKSVFVHFYLAMWIWNILATWWLVMIEWLGGVVALLVNPMLMSVPLLLFHYLHRRFDTKFIYFGWIVLWVAYEFVQLQWDLAWAWLSLGNGLASFPAIIQYYEFTGVLGGSLWLLVVNWAIWELFRNQNRKLGIVLSLLVLLPPLYSWYRFESYSDIGKAVKILVVQPNINPYTEKFAKQSHFIPFAQQFARLEKLTHPHLKSNLDLVVYPEAATGVLWDENTLRKQSNNFLEFKQFKSLFATDPPTAWLLGINTFRFLPDSLRHLPTAIKMRNSAVYYQKYNSAVFASDTNSRVAIYHKSKLVPGGESLPLLAWLKPIYQQFDDLKGVVTPQNVPTVFETPQQVKVAALVCYESTFGEFANGFVRNGAQILTIITNDAFWRNSPEPWQHLQIDRLRAIETRRAIARASHHAYSGFINQKGEIIQTTPTDRATALVETIQANSRLTFYVLYGDYIGRICVLLSGFLIFLYLFAGFRKKIK